MSLITVYMPTCNRRALVQRAVESVLQQTYEDFELIVVDDGSQDDTVAYLSKVAAKDARVRFLVNGTTLGACASRNRAILESRGRFVTGLDDDDFFMPGHLEVLRETYARFSSRLGKVAVFPRTVTRTPQGERIRQHQLSVVKQADLLRSNWIGNQIFAPREVFLAAGLFDVQMPAWQDYELWVRVAGVVETLHRAEEATYVQDESHDLHRTTTKKAALIEEAFLRFVSKHLIDAGKRARLVLRVNYHSYPQASLSLFELVEYFVHGIYFKPTYQFFKKRVS